MQYKPREYLLFKIIDSQGVFQHKYTDAFNSLKAVIVLEEKEENNALAKYIFDKFKEIEEIKDKLVMARNEEDGVPLIALEQYFLRKSRNLHAYIHIDYNNANKDIRAIELYDILENFFLEIRILAVEIANYYAIEFKTNSSIGNEEQVL